MHAMEVEQARVLYWFHQHSETVLSSSTIPSSLGSDGLLLLLYKYNMMMMTN